ncbi:uncharacterized protein BBA_06989 [Beauveria bassiana ARSEF 2860]|uniref:Uncharacterized protein n=1 Tax=Beauveria bassiana (strain ARSEF 2860) TaxID=655819 RepID=J4KMH9_BEAB2|nr:uncharacterized protein BBA_06989 [Beauveria bassiana ARSEF 2860]EJP63984.1 hypothetical protein BBA_06989 [Beauveria bassiana ARSEF 2860]
MKFLYVAYALAVPSLATVVRDEKDSTEAPFPAVLGMPQVSVNSIAFFAPRFNGSCAQLLSAGNSHDS